MATAVEMTITLGRTLYGAPVQRTEHGETENSETIEGCETRVSVTWRLTENDQNLPLTASLLAEKAVQALETADRTIRCRQEKGEDKPAVRGQEPVLSQPLSTAASAAPPANGAASANGAAASVMVPGNSTASHSHTAASVPHITKPQSLAIQSLCTRHGIADWELRRLVWEQFGKKEQSELTKEQAAELLTLLQQNTAGDAQGHAYA